MLFSKHVITEEYNVCVLCNKQQFFLDNINDTTTVTAHLNEYLQASALFPGYSLSAANSLFILNSI